MAVCSFSNLLQILHMNTVITSQLIYFMVQHLLWNISSYTAGQEINSLLLWNLEVHCCVKIILPLHPILSHFSPVLIFTSYLTKIWFYVTLPSMHRSCECPLPLRFPNWDNALKLTHLLLLSSALTVIISSMNLAKGENIYQIGVSGKSTKF